jgi:flagellar biosynthetic protein FliR
VTLNLDAVALVAFLLALVRATAFLLACPPFAGSAIPLAARAALAGGLALAAVGPASRSPLPASTAGLVGALLVQVLVGAAMGFVVQLFVGALRSAGVLVDQFSGLNLPPALDPLGLDQTPVIGQCYEWLATVLVFSSGAVLLLVRGFLTSFQVVSTRLPGADVARLPAVLGADLVGFFAASAEVAAPVVAVLLAAQLLLGLLAKAAPQTNVYALGFGLQLLVGLSVLAVSLAGVPADLTNLLGRGLAQLFGGG